MTQPRRVRASASTPIALRSFSAAATKSVCRCCRRPRARTRSSTVWRLCLDAKEQLRRYLEQRREMGESELVLDRMTIDEAMRLLAGGNRASRPSAEAPRRTRGVEAPDEAGAVPGPPNEPTAPTEPPVIREVGESQLGDWRAAL